MSEATGRDIAQGYAPAALASLDRMAAAVWRALDPDLVELTARVCANVHGYPPLARPSDCGPEAWTDLDIARCRMSATD